MEFPNLKFPEPHGKLEARMRYELGQLDPDGFAATYFDTLKRAEEQVETDYSYRYYEHEDSWKVTEIERRKAQAEAFCDKTNEEYKKIRKKIDQTMQEYLLSHDGRIDFWPDGSGFHVLSAEGNAFHFHYFGSIYSRDYSSVDVKVSRFGSEMTYQNEYHSPKMSGSNKYNADDKLERLRKEAERGKEMTEYTHGACIMGVIGAFLLAAVFVCILANLLFSAETPVTSLLIAVSNFIEDEGAGGNPYPTLRIVCLVLSVLGVWGGIAQYFVYRDFKKKWKECEQAYEAYRCGPYQQELAVEQEREARKTETRKKDIAFAKAWHDAWFEWAKSVGDTPE